MQQWTDATLEAEALARACKRAGCVVVRSRAEQTAAGVRNVGRVLCPDGWAAARLLVALASEDAQRPEVRELALELRKIAPSDDEYAALLHSWVKSHVRFIREHGEVFTGTMYTLAIGAGDCDDHTRVVLALAMAGGLPYRAAFLARPGATGPAHAVAQLCPGRDCHWAETTVDAEYGEHPYAAALRLRLTGREDITATELHTMTESDLPPVPAGFHTTSTPDEVNRDAQALERLGFLEAAGGVSNPLDPTFRAAVMHFQRMHGLKPDSLIGPSTRAAIARRLPPDEFGMGYLSAVNAVSYTNDLPDAFFRKLRAIGDELDIDPEWILAIMASESGIRSSAAYRHPPDLATGLLGFVDLAGLGAEPDNSLESHDAFKLVPETDQLDYVRKFLAPMRGRAQSAANLYQYNFLPASLSRGTAPETVLAASDGTGYRGQEARFYRVNRILDVDGDGAITVADLDAHLHRQVDKSPRYLEALARLRSVSPGGGLGSVVAGVAIGALILAAAAAAAAAHGAMR